MIRFPAADPAPPAAQRRGQRLYRLSWAPSPGVWVDGSWGLPLAALVCAVALSGSTTCWESEKSTLPETLLRGAGLIQPSPVTSNPGYVYRSVLECSTSI